MRLLVRSLTTLEELLQDSLCPQDTGVKLAWIKEIASELDPEDATLQSHLSSIALTVLKNLRQSPFQGKDARTARLASAVLESTAMSCGAQL